MHMLDIIIKKRDGHSLTMEEIKQLVQGYTSGQVNDYQMAAFLMAVYFRGLSLGETAALTGAMARSGQRLDLRAVPGIVVDKHSTGGVGDGISLVLAPLVAAAGVPVLMMSGRGLGHTGGTLDKLESIPGLRTSLSGSQAVKQVQAIGVAMIGQTGELAPADKKIYALRDATGTVENISLICASILSKKIAAGISGLVLDVKCGCGAFMADMAAARELAGILVKVGEANGLKLRALITDMDQPLGNAVGNSLEIVQALEILQDRGPKDFRELTLALGAEMLILGKKAKNKRAAIAILSRLLSNGQALAKFREMIKEQGGKINMLPEAKHKSSILARQSGYLYRFNTREIGLAASLLGAGRHTKEDQIDPAAGIWLQKKLGEKISRGELLAEFYYGDKTCLGEAKRRFLEACEIRPVKPKLRPLILAQ
jgi:pyrimidine-nucleoside phosphorylase